jgi:hypothetical protein
MEGGGSQGVEEAVVAGGDEARRPDTGRHSSAARACLR